MPFSMTTRPIYWRESDGRHFCRHGWTGTHDWCLACERDALKGFRGLHRPVMGDVLVARPIGQDDQPHVMQVKALSRGNVLRARRWDVRHRRFGIPCKITPDRVIQRLPSRLAPQIIETMLQMGGLAIGDRLALLRAS